VRAPPTSPVPLDAPTASARVTAELLRLMDRRGVSRSELARRLGASPAHVTQILRGDTNFTLVSLEKLAAALGAQLRVVLDGEPAERAAVATEATGHRPDSAPATVVEPPRSPSRPRRRSRSGPRREPPGTETPGRPPDSSWRVW
jgi:transcriptional regulator with XRE-family HTH domain